MGQTFSQGDTTRMTDLLERAAVLVLVQVVVLPEEEQVAEVLHDVTVAGALPSDGALLGQGPQVLGHTVLLVRKHQEDECRVETTDVLLRQKAHQCSHGTSSQTFLRTHKSHCSL